MEKKYENNDGDRKVTTRIMQDIVKTNTLIAQELFNRKINGEAHPEAIYVGSNADVASTSVVSDMNSSAKSKKRCHADPRIAEAAKVYVISKSTNVKKDLKQSLLAAGFSSDELSNKQEEKRLKNCVSSAASLLKKEDAAVLISPCVVLNQFNRSRIVLVEHDDDMSRIMQQFRKGSVLYDKGAWEDVNDSNLKQWIVKSYKDLGKKTKGTCLRTMFIKLFRKHGFTTEERGIKYDEMRCTVLYTRNQDYKPQQIHTDFLLKSVEEDQGRKQFLAWTAHLPITNEGSWIWLWSGPGIGEPLHIKMGQVLFLRSDVVHAGGRPPVDKLEDQKYLRLHFYLPTKYQPAPDNSIFLTEHDQWTKLEDSYAFPNIISELLIKKKKE